MISKTSNKKINKSLTSLWFLLRKNKEKCKNCPINNELCFKEHLELCKKKYNSKECRVVLGTQYFFENQENNKKFDKNALQKD